VPESCLYSYCSSNFSQRQLEEHENLFALINHVIVLHCLNKSLGKSHIGEEKSVKVLIAIILIISLVDFFMHLLVVYSSQSRLQNFKLLLLECSLVRTKLTHQMLDTSLCFWE
jgi:hypothetical protein